MDRGAVELWVRNAYSVDFLLADRERPQRMIMLLLFASRLSVAATRAERVGQLCHGEDTLGVELLSFLLRHARQQAEFILLNTLTATAGLKLALAAMPVQYKLGRRIAGQECRDVLDAPSNLADQGRSLHLQRGAAVAMHDLAESYSASGRFG